MPGELPFVSVMIPAFRQESFITEAVMSVVDQDYERLECVVRDDASPDGTAEVIRELADRHPERVRQLPGDVNLGITGNHNALLRACRGTYVAVIGGDDVALPGKVATQVEWLEADQRHVLCHHDMDVFDSDSGRTMYRYSDRMALRSGSARELLRYPAFCAAPSVMLRASAIPSHLYDVRIVYSSDWLLWMETLIGQGADSPGAGVVPGIYTRYRRHAGNVTRGMDDYGVAESMLAYDILESRAPELRDTIRHARSERLATYGFRDILRGRPLTGLARVGHGMRLSPIGVWRSVANAASYFRTARRIG